MAEVLTLFVTRVIQHDESTRRRLIRSHNRQWYCIHLSRPLGRLARTTMSTTSAQQLPESTCRLYRTGAEACFSTINRHEQTILLNHTPSFASRRLNAASHNVGSRAHCERLLSFLLNNTRRHAPNTCTFMHERPDTTDNPQAQKWL